MAWFAEPTGPISIDFLTRFIHAKLDISERRYIGFREQTSRPELITRTILEVAGTILATQLAFQYGIATNAAGGTHHAHATMGAGYTILNDLAISANFVMMVGVNMAGSAPATTMGTSSASGNNFSASAGVAVQAATARPRLGVNTNGRWTPPNQSHLLVQLCDWLLASEWRSVFR